MLIATKSCVYRVGAGPGGATPRACFQRDGVKRVAEGSQLDVVVLADGTVVELQPSGARAVARVVGEPIESVLVLREDPLEVLLGTEGAHLLRLGRGTLSRVAAFDRLGCRRQWHTPWGGPPAVRSLAVTPDGWVYADIHVGSIMRSWDRGQSWEPVTPDLHEDVHQVATCPAAPTHVYANTAKAVYVSENNGDSWDHRAGDLGERYGRAMAVAPRDADVVLATVSDGPHGEDVHGQLYRSDDAGQSWQPVGGEFPASTPSNIDTCHVAFTPDGRAWAVVGARLYVGEHLGTRWEEFWTAPEPITMLASRSA